jgi:tetratricopeptide (TPR) repeat protein
MGRHGDEKRREIRRELISVSPFIYLRVVLAATLLVIGCAALTRGQSDPGIDTDVGNPGLGGRNTIQGQIYYPSGRTLDKRVMIRMTSVRGGASSTMSNDNGSFVFRRLIDGTYHLTIDAGKEYEIADEKVDLIDTGTRRLGQTMTVSIQLRPKTAPISNSHTLDAALANVPPAAQELHARALVAARANDHKKAIELLTKALALYSDFAVAWNELGVQNMELGRYEEATEALRSALKLVPDALSTRLNYGFVLLQRKNYSSAESEFRVVIEKNDALALAHLYRGRALLGLFRDDEGEKELRRAIELGGEEVNLAHRYLGALYSERGDKALAISELEIYLRLVPKAKDAEQIREIIKGLRSKQK